MNAYLERELQSLKNECSSVNWDGDGSPAISDRSFAAAYKVARSIPETMTQPTPSVNRSGDVFFRWGSVRRRYFSLIFVGGPGQRVECKEGRGGVFSSRFVDGSVDNLKRLIAEANV